MTQDAHIGYSLGHERDERQFERIDGQGFD